MTLRRAVKAHFDMIIDQKCTGQYIQGAHAYCTDAGFVQINAPCIFHLFTAVLGYILIITGSLGQIPLLFNILKEGKSQEGRSYVKSQKLFFLLTSASTSVIYAVNNNLPISTWGESVINLAQYVIIMNLMCVYRGRHRNAIGCMLLYIIVMVTLLWPTPPLVPPHAIMILKIINLPIEAAFKAHTIYKSHKLQQDPNSKLSSRCSLLMLNLSSSGRLLTSVFHTRDPLLVTSHALGCVLDFVATSQALHYRRRRRRHSLSLSLPAQSHDNEKPSMSEVQLTQKLIRQRCSRSNQIIVR